MTDHTVKTRAQGVSLDPGPAALAAMSAAAGMDLLLAEMKALAAILPGRAWGERAEESRSETPGEGDFDDLPV